MLLRNPAMAKPTIHRLDDPANAPLLARAYLAGHPPSPLVAVLANVPELLEATSSFMEVVYGPTSLPERIKEIVVLRVSALNGCRYCTRVHTPIAFDAGLSAAEIDSLRGEGAVPGSFTDRERSAMLFAEAMCTESENAVPAGRSAFADYELVELGVVAGATIFLNRFAKAMGLS
jgi:AhpD family alkylhydroperoxidase